jgi:glycosyltransferase involved in cell wall biosynthesis
MSKNPHIAVLIMAKNEKKRLLVTLESIKDTADSLVFYDTGSEDNTIEIARNFCEENNIPLRLLEGKFKNFCDSRNESLDFADTFDDIDYLLLLDTNDELRGGKTLRENCKQYMDKPNTGFLLCQEWWSGQYDKYFNIRLVKARQSWRYRGRVHEWMKNTKYKDDNEQNEAGDIVQKLEGDLVIFQDRTQDDDKTSKRFSRDKELLLEDHNEDPEEPRTLFYLAQTCSCLGETEESFKYYDMRSKLNNGFWEEKFHSYLRCGELSQKLGYDWSESMKFYMQAFEVHNRAEPLIRIVEHYKDKNWLLCFGFAEMSCKLSYPDCLLFVDKIAYDYKRWHLLGIAGWYANEFDKGKHGCIKALESGLGQDLDKFNLKFYTDREQKLLEENKDKVLEQLKLQNPGLSKKQILNKFNKMIKKNT